MCWLNISAKTEYKYLLKYIWLELLQTEFIIEWKQLIMKMIILDYKLDKQYKNSRNVLVQNLEALL